MSLYRSGSNLLRVGGSSLVNARSLPFITAFPNTENPLQGPWKKGFTDGGGFFLDMKSTPGQAVATGPSNEGGDNYNDAVYLYDGSYGPTNSRPYIIGTIYRAAGYVPLNTHELQIYAFGVMTSTTLSVYEALLECNSSSIQMNRWDTTPYTYTLDGTFGTDISGARTGWGGPPDGTSTIECYCELVSGSPQMTFKQNGSTFWVFRDTTAGKFTTGECGFGNFYRTLPSASVPANYNWARMEVGTW